MPLQSLLDTVTRRVGAEVAALRDHARAEAAEILSHADQRASDRNRTALGNREKVLRGQADRALAIARREARRLELEARSRLLARLLEVVAARLPAAALGVPDTTIGRKFAATLASLGDRPATVRCDPGLVERLRPLVAPHRHLSLAGDPDLRGGFRLESTDGRLSIDATVDEYLARERQT
ncbi:MAG: V-type ATP synthase subunit E, partial [Stellaceae bacterium]